MNMGRPFRSLLEWSERGMLGLVWWQKREQLAGPEQHVRGLLLMSFRRMKVK